MPLSFIKYKIQLEIPHPPPDLNLNDKKKKKKKKKRGKRGKGLIKKRIKSNIHLSKPTVTIYYDTKILFLAYFKYLNSKNNCITYPSSIINLSSRIVLNKCTLVVRK